jgi:hypothetical protein
MSSTDHGRRISDGAMARMTPEQRQQRARVAALSRHHPELRRDRKAAKVEQYVQDLVDGWPPLSAEQRHRLATLLDNGAPEGGDHDAPSLAEIGSRCGGGWRARAPNARRGPGDHAPGPSRPSAAKRQVTAILPDRPDYADPRRLPGPARAPLGGRP